MSLFFPLGYWVEPLYPCCSLHAPWAPVSAIYPGFRLLDASSTASHLAPVCSVLRATFRMPSLMLHPATPQAFSRHPQAPSPLLFSRARINHSTSVCFSPKRGRCHEGRAYRWRISRSSCSALRQQQAWRACAQRWGPLGSCPAPIFVLSTLKVCGKGVCMYRFLLGLGLPRVLNGSAGPHSDLNDPVNSAFFLFPSMETPSLPAALQTQSS